MKAVVWFFYVIGVCLWELAVLALKIALVASVVLLPYVIEAIFDHFLS